MTELSEKQRDSLDEDQFAFPKERKEPLNNASHVRNAIARFNQVEGVSDSDRDDAWSRIKQAAKEAWRGGQREELARDWEEELIDFPELSSGFRALQRANSVYLTPGPAWPPPED